MGSKKSPSKPPPASKAPERQPHPADWHGEVALRLRRLYNHRIDCPDENIAMGGTIIGIPWETWAALSEERTANVDCLRRSECDPDQLSGGQPMAHENYTSRHHTGVDYKASTYSDAIPVFARRGRGPSGVLWLWFYPRS